MPGFSLDFVGCNFIAGAVVELRGARTRMVGHRVGVFQRDVDAVHRQRRQRAMPEEGSLLHPPWRTFVPAFQHNRRPRDLVGVTQIAGGVYGGSGIAPSSR
jgi:hypothetical protein